MDLEKYKEYIYNPWMEEYKDVYTTRWLTAAGWNMLIDDVFTPLIKKELGMRYMGNRIWADDYCGHRRRVLGIFQLRDLAGSIKWGWNYDFVPKISGRNAVYVRTDKSVYQNFFENIYYNHNRSVERLYENEDLIFNASNIDITDYENSMKRKVKKYTDAFYLTLPLIKAFYNDTETYRQTVDVIDILLNRSYYGMIEGENLFLTGLFLKQYIEAKEDNEKELREAFDNERTRESVLKKFYKIPKDFE